MQDDPNPSASTPADLRALVDTLGTIHPSARLDAAALSAIQTRLRASRSGADANRARCALTIDAGRNALASGLRVVGLSSLADDVLEGASSDLATVKRLRRVLRGVESQVNDACGRASQRDDRISLVRHSSLGFATSAFLEAIEAVMVKNVARAIEGVADTITEAATVHDSPEALLREAERALAAGKSARESGAIRRSDDGGIDIVGSVGPVILDGSEHSADERRGHEQYRDALVELLGACCDV